MPRSRSRRTARPRVPPQQPPQTLWAATAAGASELRPSAVPRPPVPSGSATASLRSPRSPLVGGSLTLHPEPLRVPYRFPNPDPAELTSQEPGAEGASSLPRGPLIGSAPWGRLSLQLGSSPVLSGAALGIPGPQILHLRSKTPPFLLLGDIKRLTTLGAYESANVLWAKNGNSFFFFFFYRRPESHRKINITPVPKLLLIL